MPRIMSRRHVSAFIGLVVLAAALSPPVDALADRKLSAHMVQHLALWLAAPPLLVWGRPFLTFMLALPLEGRRVVQRLGLLIRPVFRTATRPLVVWTLSTAALWLWHLPRLYQSAVRHTGVHMLEHATFIGAALVLWSAVLGTMPHRRVSRGAAILLVFATMLQSAWLAMVLSFASTVVYPVYGSLGDQQLAGVLMWVPMTTIYAIAAGALFLRWFSELDRRVRWRDAREAVPAGER
jgi:putative membrane protein